jgi:hypothetical protein
MLLSFESLFSLRKETLKGFLPNVLHYLENERYCTVYTQADSIQPDCRYIVGMVPHILEHAICKSEKIIKLQRFQNEPEQQTHALNAQ